METITKTVLPHSGLALFYDPDEDFGVRVDIVGISIDVRGSSELKAMSPARTAALIRLLNEALSPHSGP